MEEYAYDASIAHSYLNTLDLPPVLNPGFSRVSVPPTSPSAGTGPGVPPTSGKIFSSLSGVADGSSGYGDAQLSTKAYTAQTAPREWAGKFGYYFNALPEELRSVLRMDEVASFSVTEARFADNISQFIRNLPRLKSAKVPLKIVDATACVGGNSMSFLRYFSTVYAVELNIERAQMLNKNMRNCKTVLERLNNGVSLGEFKVFPGDFLKLRAKQGHHLSKSANVIFLDPPWGGKTYKDSKFVRLKLGGIPMCDVSNILKGSCQYVVMKLPVNYDVEAFKNGVRSAGGNVLRDHDVEDKRGRKKMKILVVEYTDGTGNFSSGYAPTSADAHHSSDAHKVNEINSSSKYDVRGQHALEIPSVKSEPRERHPGPKWNDPKIQKLFKESCMIPQVRGIYAWEDEPSQAWRLVSGSFPNPGVPRFKKKDDCIAWTEFVRGTPSNPDAKTKRHLQHLYTTLVGWDQVEKHLLRKREEYIRRFPSEHSSIGEVEKTSRVESSNHDNLFKYVDDIKSNIEDRLQLPLHAAITPTAALNTLRYMYFHMRCGIYVMIRRGEVKMFVPFVNDEYRNTYAHRLNKFDVPSGSSDDMPAYYKHKWSKYSRKENIIRDRSEWWANANILCNEHNAEPGGKSADSNWWGDSHLAQLRDMLESLCNRNRMRGLGEKLPDVEFFINKRDHPQLKRDLTEPYDFIFAPDSSPAIPRARYGSYAPIFSYYCGDTFADIPLPLSEDWASATGDLYPESLIWNGLPAPPRVNDLYALGNFKKFQKAWSEKRETAFFRGNMTGGGTNRTTNQRMNLVSMMVEWESSNKNIGPTGYPLLDAKGTGWNVRDKIVDGVITHPKRDDPRHVFKSGRFNFTPIYEQSLYKYIVYVDGHSAANRFAFLMRLGCVVLKVESLSSVAGHDMWFYPILRGFDIGDRNPSAALQSADAGTSGMSREDTIRMLLNCQDHISIRPDLSNLRDVLIWCTNNDEQCKILAENARRKHAWFLGQDGIMDYLDLALRSIGKRRGIKDVPFWWERSSRPLPIPRIDKDNNVMWNAPNNIEQPDNNAEAREIGHWETKGVKQEGHTKKTILPSTDHRKSALPSNDHRQSVEVNSSNMPAKTAVKRKAPSESFIMDANKAALLAKMRRKKKKKKE